MSIGTRIKEARLTLGLSQEDLAKSIGVSKGAIGNYEADISRPKENIFIDLMAVLKVDANYIYQDYIEKEKPPESAATDSEDVDKVYKMLHDGLIEAGLVKPGQDITEQQLNILSAVAVIIDSAFRQDL